MTIKMTMNELREAYFDGDVGRMGVFKFLKQMGLSDDEAQATTLDWEEELNAMYE